MKNIEIDFLGSWSTSDNGKNYSLYYVGKNDSQESCRVVLLEKTKDGNKYEHLFEGENARIELDQYLWDNFKINFLKFKINEDILNYLEQGGSYAPHDFKIIYKKMKERE